MAKFEGIITAILTPFKKDELFGLDVISQLRYLKANGISNIFACGSYGAFPVMTTPERKQAAEIIVKSAKQFGMKTIVQIGSPSTKTAIELAKHAESIGADAIASVIPFYYSLTFYNDDTVMKYYDKLINSVSIDVHCYNNSKTTGFSVGPDLLKSLMEIGLKGIKDDSKDMGSILKMLDVVGKKEFDYYPSSTSNLITGLLLGAKSCISGVSLTIPITIFGIYNLMKNGNVEAATKLWKWVMKVRAVLGLCGARAIAAYSVLKYKGIINSTCRSPWIPLTEEQEKTIISKLDNLGAFDERVS